MLPAIFIAARKRRRRKPIGETTETLQGGVMNEDIKAGDVIYAHSIHDIQRLVVTRTTRTIIEAGGTVLNRNLTRRGDKIRWSTWTYHRATPELDAQYEYHSLREGIRGRSLKGLTLDQIRRIAAIFNEETPPNAN